MKATEGISLWSSSEITKGFAVRRRCTIVAQLSKHTRKEFNASLVAADCWLYCTQQPGFFVWCKSVGVVWDSWVCGFFVGSVQGGCFGEEAGVCLCYVQNRPCRSSTLLCDEVWNNLELAIFTGRRRRATILLLCLCRGIGSLIKIML